MNLQKQMLRKYLEKFNGPTLKEIAETTGIQVTRVFRIFNGHEMKLSEYEIMNSKLANPTKESNELSHLASECMERLSPKNLKDIHDYINTKLTLSSFIYN